MPGTFATTGRAGGRIGNDNVIWKGLDRPEPKGQLGQITARPAAERPCGQEAASLVNGIFGSVSRFDIVARWADSMDISRSRVLVGEFGVMDEGGSLGTSPEALAARDVWLHDVSSIASSRGFGWAVWGYHGEFGIVSDNSARILDPGINTALFGN